MYARRSSRAVTRYACPTIGNGWRGEAHAVAGTDIEADRQQLQRLMRDAESDVAERLCGAGWLTVLDGPLHGIRHRRGLPVLGYVKTHHRRMLAHEHWTAVPSLAVRKRSGLFAMGDELYGCYLRVGRSRPVGESVGGDRAHRDAGRDRRGGRGGSGGPSCGLAAGLCVAAPPKRAGPVNLTPIAGLERRLHHLQGDPRLALRAVREAVLQRNREGWTR